MVLWLILCYDKLYFITEKVLAMTNDSTTIEQGLTDILANTYVLYLLTHNCHWNVKGINFHHLHAMFEEQYTDLAVAVDDIAERLRALGHYAEGSFAQYLERSQVKELSEQTDQKTMINALIAGNTLLVNLMRSLLRSAEDVCDDGTVDLLSSRISVHEKRLWMLNSLLDA